MASRPIDGTPTRGPAKKSAVVLILTLCAGFWLIFSGKYDALHLAYGALSIVLVWILSRRLLVPKDFPEFGATFAQVHWGRWLLYLPWLGYQILMANRQVAAIVIRPSLPLDPVLIHFHTGLTNPLAKVILGNSITLTPGTFTLRIDGDAFLVHAIREDLASGLEDGTMIRKVAELFGETPTSDPQYTVIRDRETLIKSDVVPL